MSFIKFFASVRSRYLSRRHENDAVQIMNRLRELQEIQPVVLKGTKTTDAQEACPNTLAPLCFMTNTSGRAELFDSVSNK